MVRKKPDTYIDITVDMDELDLTSSEAKATYDEIKDYIFDKYHLSGIVGIEWEDLLKNYLHKAISPIEVRAVNMKTGAASLDYFNHKNDGLRVIAVGGNSMSILIVIFRFQIRSRLKNILLPYYRRFCSLEHKNPKSLQFVHCGSPLCLISTADFCIG